MLIPPMLFDSPVHFTLGASPWWSSVWSDGWGPRCVAIAAAGAVALAALLRAGASLRGLPARQEGAERRSVGRRLADESGTVTVEFVLVFLPAIWICLVLLQTMLVFTGNLFVNYAAYAAARVAVVRAPDGRAGGGGALVYDSPVHDAIERAAAFAMAPVSGPLAAAGEDAAAFVSGLNAFYGADAPAWVDSLAGERLTYALIHTQAEFFATGVSSNGVPTFDRVPPPTGDGQEPDVVELGSKDPVTVGVNHRFHLSIPYASFFFQSGEHQTQGGRTTPYTNISATCTLTLEGYDRALPPLPDVEREN